MQGQRRVPQSRPVSTHFEVLQRVQLESIRPVRHGPILAPSGCAHDRIHTVRHGPALPYQAFL